MPKTKQNSTGGYTKAELRIYKYPLQGLAAAVVKQWRMDGCPKNCYIEPWIAILEQAVHRNDSREEGGGNVTTEPI